MELCVFAEVSEIPFELELLSDEGSRSVSVLCVCFFVCLFFPNMIVFMLCIPVVHRMLWRSAGLASKKGNSNDSSLFPGLLCGAWDLPEPYGRLSCLLPSARRLARKELVLCSAVLIILTVDTICQALC